MWDRLGIAVFWTGGLLSIAFLGMMVATTAPDLVGQVTGRPGPTAVAISAAVVPYAIGWALRFILTGRRSLL